MEKANKNLDMAEPPIAVPTPVPVKQETRTELMGLRVSKRQKAILRKVARQHKCNMSDLLYPAIDAVIMHWEEQLEAKA